MAWRPLFYWRGAILLCALWLAACGSHAQPASRIIVQFTAPLEPTQQQDVRDLLEAHNVPVLELAESSSERRWVVILPPTLSKDEIATLNASLTQLPFVEFAEEDALLGPAR